MAGHNHGDMNIHIKFTIKNMLLEIR